MSTEQQIPKLLASLVEHQQLFKPLSTDNAQWVIQNTSSAIDLFIKAIEHRISEEHHMAIRVNYGLSIDQMTNACANISVADKKRIEQLMVAMMGEADYEWKLFHFNAGLSAFSAEKRIREKGWEPASIEHFFAIVPDLSPEQQMYYPIAILGSRACVYGGNKQYVLVLNDLITRRNESYISFCSRSEDIFHCDYRYLAVRPVRT